MSSSDETSKPKRRLRYKGTHPRKFSEKYKELDPARYADAVEKVKQRGATPVGTHRPICVNEILEILNPKPGETVLDATLGYGGHASLIFPKLLPGGRLIGLDRDPIERPKTEERLRKLGFAEKSLIVGAINFSEALPFLRSHRIDKVHMILADLGVSSMQLDDPARGFSFKIDAPLDLRMNPYEGQSAAALLSRIKEDDLIKMLLENADEFHAPEIAKVLLKKKPKTTFQLNEAVLEVTAGFSPQEQREEGQNPIRRVFQALRIAVNNEFSALDQFLKDVPEMLRPRGRVALLSFHSGEDRRVKKSFQALKRAKIYRKISEGPIRPSFEEQRSNPRSKSAKLRWACT